jgi:polyisoprenyl-phosphate glycosyltransferase
MARGSPGKQTERLMSKTPRPTYSIVAPIYNESGNIEKLYARISEVMDSTGEPWELITVNDGSRDDSLTKLEALNTKDDRIKVINFARNFGHQTAVTAGMDYSRGKAVIIIDADLQDPPEVILELITKWKEGFQVVYAQRETRQGESAFKLLTAKLFYRLIYAIADIQIPLDTGDFRLMDRRVVDAVSHMREHNRFIRGMASWVGFKQTGVLYKRAAREWGQTSYPLKKMLKLAWDAITGFSFWPLQVAAYISVIFGILAFLAIPVVAILRLATGEQGLFSGQATAIVLILAVACVTFFMFFVIGQYIARIYDEVRGRPLYIVADTHGMHRDQNARYTGKQLVYDEDEADEAEDAQVTA